MNTATLPVGAVSLASWFVAALLLSAALVPLCRTLAVRHGFVARPRQDRWHTRPTALFGGVGIALTVLTLAPLGGDARPLALLLAGGALIFVVGLADDVVSLKPSTKLIAEIVLASGFVLFDGRLHWSEIPALDMLLTLVWLVGVTNAFNLLDNMDGLCAGVALIAGIALMMGVIGRADVLVETRYLAIVLGATAGFLIYNRHPASIFMGDAGSLFLGLTLASLTVTIGGPAHDRSRVLSVVVAPMLVLLIPIFDTTLVTIMRLLSGRPVSQGGRDHSSHRLVAIGLPEKSAVRVLWGLAAAGGLIGFTVRRVADERAWLLGAVFILAMVVFAVYLAQVRVYDSESVLTSGRVTPMIANFMYKRRVAEVLLDVCLVTIAYWAAWRLRFDGPEWQAYLPSLLASLPIALAVQMVALFVFGAYRGAWRYFGLMDGVVFGKAIAAGTLCTIVGIVYLYRFDHYSRGVFIIYAAMAMLLLCGSRASFRLIGEYARRRRTGTRLVIYGAGEAASLVLRELLADRTAQYQMVGFIDDDPGTHWMRLQGYPVLGDERVLTELVDRGEVQVVVIGSREIAPDRVQRIEQQCRAKGVQLLRFTFQLERLVSPPESRSDPADPPEADAVPDRHDITVRH